MTAKELASRGELLVVDDSHSSLAYLSMLLSQAGYFVREALDGELALRTVSVRQPELILLDVRMPGLDGFEVCRRLKADAATRAIPVIFLSAQDETTDRVLGLKVGAIDFISKSAAPEEMLARIDTHITLARVEQALKRERAGLEDKVRERTEELRQGRALLRTVIDSGPDWICAVDRERRCLLVNRSMAAALGQADAEDLSCFSCNGAAGGCQTHDDMRVWEADEREVFAGRTVYHPRERIVLPDGRSLFFETYKTPLKDAQGEPYGVLCYRRDISQRLAVEDENRKLEQALWQAKKMEAIGQLAGGIAHDFNHLLSLVLGYAEFARTALAHGKLDKLDGYLAEVLKAGGEGQAVVAQLLAFSRKEEPAQEAVAIGPLLMETVAALQPAMGSGIRLELDLAAELPPVLIKPGQLRQVLTNLILNARDASAPGGRVDVSCRLDALEMARICSSCRKDFRGSYLRLAVVDAGSGIATELLDKVFDPFFTTKDIGKGAGLGLPMVHGIVHSAGGHVELIAPAAGGTKFYVWIPVPPARV